MKQFYPALRLKAYLSLVLGLLYPFTITGMGQILFHHQANGSLIYRADKIVGSELIAQKFESANYFWSRPSAVSYDPLASGGSNFGPLSADLSKRKAESIAKMPRAPNDLLYTSASGLDPHISVEAANFQVPRVSKARNIPEQKLRDLIQQTLKSKDFGIFGESRVNVLALNMALDKTNGP